MSTTEAAPKEAVRRSNLVQDIEVDSGRMVLIDSEETDDTLSKCHPQDQSLLFALLPREIRDLIWAFATAPYEDETKRYATNEFYCRPGHTAPLLTDTNLLRTCRRIWLESNALPMLQAEHDYWYHRRAPKSRTPGWSTRLMPANLANFGHLHLFAQMYVIEGLKQEHGSLRAMFLEKPPVQHDFQPRVMHVTIRHTDWWWWEHEHPLFIRDQWVQALLNTPDLRSTHILKLELETLDYKVDQLIRIVAGLQKLASKEYQSHIVDGRPVSTKFVLEAEPKVHKWQGPVDIAGKTFKQYRGKDCLDYHVVTLTWRLAFPEFPKANVQALRRATRISPFPKRSLACSVGEDAPDTPDTRRGYFSNNKSRNRRAYKSRHGRTKYSWKAMLDAGLHVRMEGVYLARTHEHDRAQIFTQLKRQECEHKWQAQWESEKSLLRFEE